MEVVPGVAEVDGDELEDAGVAVAIDHAAGAAVANEFIGAEIVDAADGLLPEMAAVKLEVPIEVEVFMAAEAAEFLGLAAEEALHFAEGFAGVLDRESGLGLEAEDAFVDFDEFLDGVIDEAGIAEAEITGFELGEGVAKGAVLEAERGEEVEKFSENEVQRRIGDRLFSAFLVGRNVLHEFNAIAIIRVLL